MTLKEKAMSAINGRVKSEQDIFAACEKTMKENFTKFFAYSADKAYKSARMISVLTDVSKLVEQAENNDILSQLADERDFYLNRLVNGQVTGTTNVQLYNLSQMYEMELNQELYKFFSRLYEGLNKEFLKTSSTNF